MHRARTWQQFLSLSLPAVLSVVALAGGDAWAQDTGVLQAAVSAAPAGAATAAPYGEAAATVAVGTAAVPEGFAPAAGPPTERIPGGPLVIAAYAAIWTLLLVFLVSMWIRQESLRKELERLRERVPGEKSDKPGTKG